MSLIITEVDSCQFLLITTFFRGTYPDFFVGLSLFAVIYHLHYVKKIDIVEKSKLDTCDHITNRLLRSQDWKMDLEESGKASAPDLDLCQVCSSSFLTFLPPASAHRLLF